MYDFDEFKTAFNIRGTVLDFQGLLNRLPNVWRNLPININNVQICIKMKYNITYPKQFKVLLEDRKGCRKIYEIYIKCKNNTLNRWQRDLGEIPKEEINKYNKALNDINEVKLKEFEFMINNKILTTNSFLGKIKKKLIIIGVPFVNKSRKQINICLLTVLK